MTFRTLSPDGQVVALLTSPHVGTSSSREAPAPLRPGEWHALAARLEARNMGIAELFLQHSTAEWEKLAELDSSELDRIQGLLSRAGTWAFEQERLAGLGIWIVTVADATYPRLLRDRLVSQAPPVLFGAGAIPDETRRWVALVGSRDVDSAGGEFTRRLAERCAEEGLGVVSGGARGVDRIALGGAVDNGGCVVAVVPGQMEQILRERDTRQAIAEECLTLLSPYHPAVAFSVGGAMGRNKLIYAFAHYAVVIASAYREGGTWSGATENLKQRWVPLFVRSEDDAPEGNRQLMALGGLPLTPGILEGRMPLSDWFEQQLALRTASPGSAVAKKRAGKKHKKQSAPRTPELFDLS